MSNFLWSHLDFLMDGSMFATGALWMLSGTASLYVLTRCRDFLLLFVVTLLYLIPFLVN